MNKQIPTTIGILIIFFLTGIVLGVIFFNKDTNYTVITNDISEDIEVDEGRKREMDGFYLLIVEDEIAGGLFEELERYKKDIKEDLGWDTKIQTFSSMAKVEEIKEYIAKTYKSENLKGVMLVGNIPVGYYNISNISGNDIIAPTDSIYQDIDNTCQYDKILQAYNWRSCGEAHNFFVSRLTPNSSTEDSLTLLKKYFERNHQYRKGEYEFQKKALLYLPFNYTEHYFKGTMRDEMEKSKNLFKFRNAYEEKNIVMIDIERPDSDELFFEELVRPQGYELVQIHAHGSPNFHEKNIIPESIPRDSSFFFLILNSCTTGDITQKDYIAGTYLFEGNGLVAIAPTVIDGKKRHPSSIKVLTLGEPIFKAMQVFNNTREQMFFGDMTLRMNYEKLEKDQGLIVKQDILEFSRKEFFDGEPYYHGFLDIKNEGEKSCRYHLLLIPIVLLQDINSPTVGRLKVLMTKLCH